MVAPVLRLVPERVRGLRVAEWDALVATGLLDDARVELIQGEVVEMAPLSPEHTSTVKKVYDSLRAQVPAGWDVRAEAPLAVPPSSEPQPDVAVVPDEDYDHRHPTRALLLVEVARSSLPTDLEVKPGVYAAARVEEYWVIDPDARVAHVHRARGADGYHTVTVQAEADGTLVSSTEPSFTLDLRAVLPRDRAGREQAEAEGT